MKKKYETCIHVQEVGSYAVYVHPSCPKATMIKGVLVSSRKRCASCRNWKERTT